MPSWRRGTTEVRASDLSEHLYRVARHHALTAMSTRETTDEFEMLDAAAHAGAAVELICKAIIARVEPILLTDKPTGNGSLLDVITHLRPVPNMQRSEKRFISVGAGVALGMACKLSPECFAHRKAAEDAQEIRNDALHMGFVDGAKVGVAIEAMATFVTAAAGLLGRTPDRFWGSAYVHEAESAVLTRHEREKAAADEKIASARGTYNLGLGGVEASIRAPLIKAAEAIGPFADDSWQVDCPACEQRAWLAWDVDAEYERDGDGGYNLVGGARLLGLECRVCGLQLTAPEVRAVDVETDDYREYDGHEYGGHLECDHVEGPVTEGGQFDLPNYWVRSTPPAG